MSVMSWSTAHRNLPSGSLAIPFDFSLRFRKPAMTTLTSTLRLPAALLLSCALAACGGYTAVNLGGAVAGLTTSGLVLSNGTASTVSIPANATIYTFPNQIDVNAAFAIKVQTQPARLTCAVANATGSASGIAITTANVICVPNKYTLGGTIASLNTAGLVLTNGSDTVSPAAGAQSFTLPTTVADGTVYGVAVLTQPAGQTCRVVAGTGTAVMGSAPVTSVQVSCA
jgi:hypothetical protein